MTFYFLDTEKTMPSKIWKYVTAILIASGISCTVGATTLNFENGLDPNFTFANLRVITASDYSSYQGIPQGLVSGTHVVINNNFGSDSISSSALFSLNSGYFTSFDGSGTPLTVSGYTAGNLVGTQTFQITDKNSTFITFDQNIFGSVNSVSFNNNPNALVFDDLTVNGQAAVVPEPAPLALLGLGLVGFIASRRKSAK